MAKTKTKTPTNGAPKNRIASAEKEVTIYDLVPEIVDIPIKQLTPMIQHRFDDKVRKQIEDKQQQKAKTAREKREPEREMKAALYLMPGASAEDDHPEIGFPASAFKQAFCEATRFYGGRLDLPKTLLTGAVFVIADAAGLVRLDYDTILMRSEPVRVGGRGKGTGSLDMRYRPEIVGWSANLQFNYNSSVISVEQILNLLNIAGFSIGVGDYRPEKMGEAGRFSVDHERMGQ